MSSALPQIGLGCAGLAGLYRGVAEADAVHAITQAHELGIRYFDTAPMYGYGEAETRLGQSLAALADAGEVFVSTKVGRLLDPIPGGTRGPHEIWGDVPPLRPRFDFSREGALASLEASYRRLGGRRADLVLVHDPDDHFETARDGACQVLAELKAAGEIRWVGVGANQIDIQLRLAADVEVDYFLLAGRYTLLDHERTLREYFPVCQAQGIGVIAAGVLNSGILAAPGPGAHYDYVPASPEVIDRALRLDAVCRRHGVPLKAAALQFPLAHPAVAALLIGASYAHEVEDTLAMLRTPIPVELWDDLKSSKLLSEACPVPAEPPVLISP